MENQINKVKAIYDRNCAKRRCDIAGHLPLIYELATELQPRVIVHAGIRGGSSDSAFALAALEQDIHLVDIDVNDVSDAGLIEVRDTVDKWVFHKGRTDNQDIVNAVSEHNGQVDIFFTDTSHNYPDTKFELENYTKFLSDRGIIMIHDMDPWKHYPDQAKAVDEFLEANPEFQVKVQKGNNGMAVLYRDEAHLCGVVCDKDTGIGTHTA